jgi:hypothetical protein
MPSNFLRAAGSALTGVGFGLVGVFLYAQGTLTEEDTRPPLTTKVDLAAPARDQATPSATPESSSDERASGAPDGSASSAAAAPMQVRISPAFAGVSVAGKALTAEDGAVGLEGKPGDVVYVRLQVGGASQTFRVRLTDSGPEPATLSFDTPPAGAAPGAAPAKAPPAAPAAPPPAGPAPAPIGDEIYE